jgi:hypothetical protein
MSRRITSALPSWALTVAGTAYAVILADVLWPTVISVTLGASLVLSFVIQLSLQRKEGLVNRLAFTTSGSLIIGAVGIAVCLVRYGIG